MRELGELNKSSARPSGNPMECECRPEYFGNGHGQEFDKRSCAENLEIWRARQESNL